jgi:hypothetical protein
MIICSMQASANQSFSVDAPSQWLASAHFPMREVLRLAFDGHNGLDGLDSSPKELPDAARSIKMAAHATFPTMA